MKFPEFFNEIRSSEIEVQFDRTQEAPPPRLDNEAMFHLPLIAISILMMSKGHVKPTVDQLGQLVGDCFERTFPGFRGSAQHLGWSASLRVRTVQALAFLELAGLVNVEEAAKRIAATSHGRAVIEHAISEGGDLASHLVVLERSYRDIRSERQLRFFLT